MRVLFTSMIASSVLLIHVLDNPALFSDGWVNIKQRGIKLLNTKEVRIEGLHALSRSEVERVLPMSKSPVWWMLNETSIQAKLAENPWIKGASVESCPGTILPKFGCFIVSVEERKPRFIAVVDNERWIIGADGTFIMPAAGAGDGISQQSLASLIPLKGLASRVSAGDRTKAQLATAEYSIAALERSVQLPVRAISFEGKNDIAVTFDRIPFPVVFSAPSDIPSTVEEQGRRCRALLLQLKDRLNEIEKVDLAFAKVGVVKFRTVPEPKEVGEAKR